MIEPVYDCAIAVNGNSKWFNIRFLDAVDVKITRIAALQYAWDPFANPHACVKLNLTMGGVFKETFIY